MRHCIKIFYSASISIVTILFLIDSGLIAQPIPMPLPPSRIVPWGNLIFIIAGFLAYGIIKIIQKDKR